MSFQEDTRPRRKNSSEATLQRAREIWREPFVGFTVYDLLHTRGSALDALLNAHLFWPQFVICEGMTLLPFVVEDESDRDRVSRRLQSLADRSQVEEEFNYVEVSTLFGRRRGETSDEEDAMLAGYLVEMWTSKLTVDFPGKTFRVRLIEPSSDTEVAVTLCEQR